MTSNQMSVAPDKRAQYPAREPFFAHRFCRLLIKSCAAQQLGPSTTLLLMTIALTEDAARYKRGVTFWDGQLMPIIGISSWRALNRARVAAVEEGWLVYIPGGKARAGVYWVTIPACASGIEDFPVDEGAGETYLRSAGANACESEMHLRCAVANGGDASTGSQAMGLSKSSPFNPVPYLPFPDPNQDFFEPPNEAPERSLMMASAIDQQKSLMREPRAERPDGNSTQLPNVDDPIILSIPCVGRGPNEWFLRKSKLDEYAESFPGIDVLAHCRQARQWAIDNPTKRKTYRGVAAFLTGWLSRTQNKGANQSGFNAGRTYQPSSDPTRFRSGGASQYDGIV